MNWENGIPFPGSNIEYRSTSKDLNLWAYQLSKRLRSNVQGFPRIANLCDGIGEFSKFCLKHYPGSQVHSIDLGNFKHINHQKKLYDRNISYHWQTDLFNFLSNSEDESFDLITMIRAHFITFTYPNDTTGQMLDPETVNSNVNRLIELIPRKLKPGGFFFFTSPLLNPDFTDGLISRGLKPLDINQWLWEYESGNRFEIPN